MQFDLRNGSIRKKYDSLKYTLRKLENTLYELSLAEAGYKRREDADRVRSDAALEAAYNQRHGRPCNALGSGLLCKADRHISHLAAHALHSVCAPHTVCHPLDYMT